MARYSHLAHPHFSVLLSSYKFVLSYYGDYYNLVEIRYYDQANFYIIVASYLVS